jgi:phosphoglycolate phosphatase
MYKTIMFDLDGTITDTGLGITNAVMYALEKFDIKTADRTQLYKFIGPPLRDSFRNFYGFSDEQAEIAVKYYREYYSVKGLYENEIYDGIETLLEKLYNSGKTIVTATSKPEEYAVKIIERLGISKYFTYIAGADMEGKRGSKSDVIRYVLETCNIFDFSEVVMIGDREFDVKGSAEFGIDCIGILFGYGNYDELKNAGAKYIASTADEICSFIMNNEK